MKTLLATLAAALLSVAASAQEIPGLSVSIRAPSIVAAQNEVPIQLTVRVKEDTEVPVRLLNGADLTVRCNGETLQPISDPGKGQKLFLTKGTQLDRILTYPATRFMADPKIGEIVTVAVGWKGLIGVDCTFKVAPDTKNVKIEDLDLEKTEVMLITNYGDIQLTFRPDKAPEHVENFIKLCLQGFYDGTKFHRVVRNFMIQGGCPHTKHQSLREKWGTGGAGYTLKLEPSDLRHLRGTLSMARSPNGKNTASSGFFIVHKDSAHLDGGYSAFGNVIAGMDTVDRIANVRTAGPTQSAPVQPVILEAAVVLPKKKKQ